MKIFKFDYKTVGSTLGFNQLLATFNQIIVSIIGICRTIVIVRLLSPEDYGIIGVAIAVGSSFSIFQNLGLGVGVAKEAAQARDQMALRLVSIIVLLVRYAMLLPLLAMLIFVGTPYAMSLYKIDFLDQYIMLYAIFIFVSAPGDILGYILTGTSRFTDYFLLKFINEIVLTLSVCGMIYIYGIDGYFYGQVVAGGMYTILSAIMVWRAIGGPVEIVPSQELKLIVKSVFKTSLSVFFAKLARGFSLQITILIAALYVSVHDVGLLKFGMQAGGYFAASLSAIQAVTLPSMTSILNKYGKNELFKRFADNYYRLCACISILMVFVVLLAPVLIWIIGGDLYVGAARSFQLVVVFYSYIIFADNIFTGIHFPLDMELRYVVSYFIYFVISIFSTYVFYIMFTSLESGIYGLCIGSIVHLLISYFQTNKFKALFNGLSSAIYILVIIFIITLLGIMSSDLSHMIILNLISLFMIAIMVVRKRIFNLAI